jgi:hypothetical protein
MKNYLKENLSKKITAFILLCCVGAIAPSFLYAQQDKKNASRIDVSFNIGDIGYGMLFRNNTHTSFAYFNILNLYIEDDRTALGLKLSPFYFSESIEKRRSLTSFSLLNADVYWNPFPKVKRTAMMVPFASVNYFTYNNDGLLDTSQITLSTGWRFAYVGRGDSIFRYDTYAEVGLRYFNNELYYYFTLNLDITILAALLLMSAG